MTSARAPKTTKRRPLTPALSPSRGRGRLRLVINAQLGARHVPFLRRHLRRAHEHLNPTLREMSLALVNDARMSALHARFMNVAGPTDVLTFPLDEDARGRAISGEVVVCVPEARRRARELRVPVERELLLYALHGMLHLCGFDDRTDRDFARMHRTEDMILAKLGVGPVFDPNHHEHRRNRTPNAEGSRR